MKKTGLLESIGDIGDFFHKLRHRNPCTANPISIENLAQKIDAPVPSLLAGCLVTMAVTPFTHKYNCVVSVVSKPPASKLTNYIRIHRKDAGPDTVTPERGASYCYRVDGRVPFTNYGYITICIRCADKWGDGCDITVYY